MTRVTRRNFIGTAALASAAVAPAAGQEGGARGNPFSRVRDIEEQFRRVPSERFPLPFTNEEYAARLKRCRDAMSKRGIDLLLVTWPEGICYLHGYEVTWWRTYWVPTTTTAVHVDHDKVLFYGGEDPVPSAATDRRRIAGGGTPEEQTKGIADDLQKEGWLKKGTTVGLEFQSYQPTPAVSRLYESACADKGAKVVDGSVVMRTIRNVKSPAEIAAMEHATRIVDIGHRAIAQNFQPGMSHGEVFAEAFYAMFKAGGEWPGLPQGVVPGKPASLHLLPNPRQIKAGESFSVDLGGVYKRYHVNVSRAYIYGDPSRELVQLSEASAGAYDLLAKIAKAGTPVSTVTRALREYYQAKGIWEFRGALLGYEIGIAFPPDWVGHFRFGIVNDAPTTSDVFLANSVTQYETIFRRDVNAQSLVVDNIDTYVYEAGGARRLSAIPVQLIVLG